MKIFTKIILSATPFFMFLTFATASGENKKEIGEQMASTNIEIDAEKTNQTNKKTITGIIYDEQGGSLPGVDVYIENTRIRTTTDLDGKFSITFPDKDNSILVVKFIGMMSQEIKIGNKTSFDITLKSDINSLDEIVIVGYGSSTKKDLTGSVSRISSEELKTAPMGGSVQNMLQGRAAGVNVQISSASPTSPVSVVIRGASSLSGNNQPLWIIDGVPQYSTGTSGDVSNTLYNLNLNDVESLDILKDASATAIYGSRAANGVVIVTTKRGKEGMKPTIEVQARVGIQTIDNNNFNVLNAQEYVDFSKAAAKAQIFRVGNVDYFSRRYIDRDQFNKINTSQWDQETYENMFIDDYYYGADTDWWDLMTQEAITQEYNLSIYGGTKQTSYYGSFFYKDQGGIVKGSASQNIGGRFNFETKIREIIKLGLNIDLSARDADVKDAMIEKIIEMRPDYPAYNEDGTINTIDSYVKNPLIELEDQRKQKGRSLAGTLFLEYDMAKFLKFKTSGTVNYAVSELDYFEKVSYGGDTNSADKKIAQNYVYVWENLLTFYKTIGKHDMQALLGQSVELNENDYMRVEASDFPDDDVLTDLGSAAARANIYSEYYANAMASFFGRVQYKFDDRYLATATIRTDGSSRFGSDRRWGIFPSGALAWIVTEEDFMENIKDYVSYLKVRGSYGLTGSQNLGNYDWQTLMGSSTYNGNPGMAPSSLGNLALQWESQTQLDIGLDYGFWDDRILGSIGYYRKDIDNIIYGSPVPYSSSFKEVERNIGAIRNEGVEFDIKIDIIKNNNITWDFNFNIASNKGTLVKLNGTDEFYGGTGNYTVKVEEGGELGEFYGYVDAGRLLLTEEELIALKPIDPKTGKTNIYRDNYEAAGDAYLMDLDGDGKITADDRQTLGNPNPDFFGGFGSSLYWKGLMLNLTFTYSYGGLRYWKEESNSASGINSYNSNNIVLDSWVMKPGEGKFPYTDYYGRGSNSKFSNRWLHDASFLRLGSVNIAYRLPNKFFRKSLIKGIEFQFQATNLFTITNYPGMDPQGNFTQLGSDGDFYAISAFGGTGTDYSTYPSARTFNLSVKITLQ